ncbi:arabinose efflux permease family protein [Burkholderiales bacterium JOSHI_001]|nr:arabinose efflux permease family protein [Burkholderiales bacterium JOSHI_001]
MAQGAALPLPAGPLRQAQWSLMAANFAIGCGVMVVAGAMNNIVQDLQISLALGGQLVTIGAVVVGLGAPLLAAVVGGTDRRRLLTFWLAWFGLGHLLSAWMPAYAPLALLRAATMLGAAVVTPQAAAAIGVMAPPEQRGRAITFVFLGWSVASVLGMPLHAYIAEVLSWRWAFAVVGLLGLASAAWVWHAVPDGVKPAPLSMAAWRATLTNPALMAVVAVTVASSAGQFTQFAYMAPYYRQVLHASPAQVSALFMSFGAFGFIGNVWLSRRVDHWGAARAVLVLLGCIAVSLLAWPLATGFATMLLVTAPWGLGCFASNSAQQARLGLAAPALAPALMALNSSAMYVGQAIGAAMGGAMLAASGFQHLHAVGLAWVLGAMALSVWAERRLRERAARS